MATLQDREKDFENRFKHEQDLRFKIAARRNRLLGLWAAEKMGLSRDEAEAYAKTVVIVELTGGEKNVVATVVADLAANGQSFTTAQVKFELDHFAVTARQQVMAE